MGYRKTRKWAKDLNGAYFDTGKKGQEAEDLAAQMIPKLFNVTFIDDVSSEQDIQTRDIDFACKFEDDTAVFFQVKGNIHVPYDELLIDKKINEKSGAHFYFHVDVKTHQWFLYPTVKMRSYITRNKCKFVHTKYNGGFYVIESPLVLTKRLPWFWSNIKPPKSLMKTHHIFYNTSKVPTDLQTKE